MGKKKNYWWFEEIHEWVTCANSFHLVEMIIFLLMVYIVWKITLCIFCMFVIKEIDLSSILFILQTFTEQFDSKVKNTQKYWEEGI